MTEKFLADLLAVTKEQETLEDNLKIVELVRTADIPKMLAEIRFNEQLIDRMKEELA